MWSIALNIFVSAWHAEISSFWNLMIQGGLERQCINYQKLRAFQDSQAALYIESWADSGSRPI